MIGIEFQPGRHEQFLRVLFFDESKFDDGFRIDTSA